MVEKIVIIVHVYMYICLSIVWNCAKSVLLKMYVFKIYMNFHVGQNTIFCQTAILVLQGL